MLIFGPGLGAGCVAGSIGLGARRYRGAVWLASGISNAAFQIGGALVWRCSPRSRLQTSGNGVAALTHGYQFAFVARDCLCGSRCAGQRALLGGRRSRVATCDISFRHRLIRSSDRCHKSRREVRSKCALRLGKRFHAVGALRSVRCVRQDRRGTYDRRGQRHDRRGKIPTR